MVLQNFKKKYQDWQNQVRASALREREAKFVTSSQIPIQPFYDVPQISDYELPGEFPFTRGVHPTLYRGRLWTMRLYSGFATAKESNARYKELVANGGTGLSVAFDLPTQMGLDSDDPRALGEVGKAGVAIDTVEDVQMLFDGIDLSKISVSLTINATAAVLLCMVILVAERSQVPLDQLSGTIQNDILKEYIARGTYIYPPKPSMRLITDIFSYCQKFLPKWNTISISGYHIREAGSDAVQEVAFTLANGLAYVAAAQKTGLNVNEFAPRLSFFFNAHNHFFEEVAKFRAARRLWAKLLRERFQALDEACRLRFHTQTGGSTLTAQQIDNNVVRVAYQALSAVLGGTQSLHTNGRDEALSLPTEESARLALRTQQILAYETGVADTIDPLAGSYYVESLTDEIEKRARELIEKIDDLGGAVSALTAGYQQNEIHNTAYQTQKEIEEQKRVVVGVNRFSISEPRHQSLHKVLDATQNEQIQTLKAYKAARDSKALQLALEALKQAAQGDDNLLPHILQALRVKATLGEISGALRDVFGTHPSF